VGVEGLHGRPAGGQVAVAVAGDGAAAALRQSAGIAMLGGTVEGMVDGMVDGMVEDAVWGRRTLTDLVDAVHGRVICLNGSKDPNAKMTILFFEPGHQQPSLVAKVPTTDAATTQVCAEARVLKVLAELPLGSLERTIPRQVGMVEHLGRPVLVTRAIAGRSMFASYHDWRHTADAKAVASDFSGAGRWLQTFSGIAAGGPCVGGPCDLAELATGLEAALQFRFGDDAALAADLDSLAAVQGRLAGVPVPVAFTHGDFWPGNVLTGGGSVKGVVDWESGHQGGLSLHDVARFALTYSLYLDRHTAAGEPVPGHEGLRAGRWGAGVEYALGGTGWYPALVRSFVADGLVRVGAPPARWRDVVLVELLVVAAQADHRAFAGQHLRLFRRLTRGPSR
jgi:hypothetical protein